eukprot:scaffold1888_cov146-Skeletonema_menzelii.AAC.6
MTIKLSGFVGGCHNNKEDDTPSARQSSAIISRKTTSPSQDGNGSGKHRHRVIFFAAYILFGTLHELFHVLVAKIIVMLRSSPSMEVAEDKFFLSLSSSIGKFLSRAVFGRYTIVTIPSATNADGLVSSEAAASIITHSGWILSLLLAVGMHYFYARLRNSNKNTIEPAFSLCSAVEVAPMFILAAYIAAVESITSDLMGFVPKM